MNIKLPNDLPTTNGETAALQSASQQLEEMAGQSVIPASGEWELVQDPTGDRRYRLRLSDYLGQVSGEFTSAELRSPRQLRHRLIRLWGDHLQMRSHQLFKNLMEPSSRE